MKKHFLHTPIQASLCKIEMEHSEIQERLHKDPIIQQLVSMEFSLAQKLKEIKFIQQQTKVNWLKYGDENSTVFHNSLKQRRANNRINMLIEDGYIISEPAQIRKTFIAYYSDLLCSRMTNRERLNMQVIQLGPTIAYDD